MFFNKLSKINNYHLSYVKYLFILRQIDNKCNNKLEIILT